MKEDIKGEPRIAISVKDLDTEMERTVKLELFMSNKMESKAVILKAVEGLLNSMGIFGRTKEHL